ncbi:WS/DGAT/MGAT family O-acyltransferase [Mycobacterium nebraskense]|uniref:Diacylglycerol O-acyltransferase n=1 Tax=Mycobacterium nebraskense TaxID=244292 RepID=A0A0F5N9P7_9MYCO|nr:wax ester/triacylglycerol synthase family O-acyltransferase [Mycobacterium nebraskense]KKC03580.1 diacylglycerol O-acyltransferase [Mycobacterium nebraskense]KLO38268.1 diacylglycerol O-acyltransferase [Mycobacterium nebraskense]MBI2695239.1 wax ester/triacylglycerol synthase family O-acyltransferase [Mycobacterium nebraskense]MCV7118831.1 wax ester/triacylglycerol synthase family O-acyltransferase [Mycobacterium nebraskense]ORW20831.1 diacylglycerol O-acyltransferase [Mycobacterium nebrask
MEQLTTLEASFLEAEDADRHVSMAIGTLAVIDGPTPDRQQLIATLSERIRGVPRFTQLVHKHALDLTAPGWVDDTNFDIDHHVRSVALPPPGDDSALFRLIADLMERRLDRDHPLWECWVIEGLPDGRWAMLVKIHHCLADGIAVVRIIASLADAGTGETYASDIRAAKELPSSIVLTAGLSRDPRTWAGGLWRASVATTSTAAHTAMGATEFITGLLAPASGSSLRGSVSNMRRYSAARVSMKDVETVRQAFGVTLNDVALAAITDSFRTVLIRRGEKPRRNSLRTMIPVSMRSPNTMDCTDIRVSAMLSSLPVEEHDPVKRLKSVHARLGRLKASGERQAAKAFVTLTNYLPFALNAWTVRLLTRLPQRSVVTLATNVPGPRLRLQVMGHPVEQLLPIPPIALQLRTVISMLSYVDELAFGITADYDAAPDVDELARGIELGVARLVTRALSRKPTHSKQSRRAFPIAN